MYWRITNFRCQGKYFILLSPIPFLPFFYLLVFVSLSVSNELLSRFCLSNPSSLLPLSRNDSSSVLCLLPYPSNSAKAEIFFPLWRDRNCLFWCLCYGNFVLLQFMFSATKFREILPNLKWIIGFTFSTCKIFIFIQKVP
jgi:hypothetical protein